MLLPTSWIYPHIVVGNSAHTNFLAQLQHYYDVIAEKVSAEVAYVVVWEGAAGNKRIESGLGDIVDEDSYLVDTR